MYENVKNGHREFHHSGTLSYSTALVLAEVKYISYRTIDML